MTLSYELRERLKEAGFKLPVSLCLRCIEDDLASCKDCENIFAHPPLSELIDACGGEFFQLTQFHVASPNGLTTYWFATANGEVESRGNAPEEAVAKLWLKIQDGGMNGLTK